MSDLVAYVDGGSLGNPGPSGIGVVIEGSNSGTIRIARWIGRQDNNVAEYVALLEALQCAKSLQARRVRLPQPASLFPALDLPQAGAFFQVFNHACAPRAQCRSQ